MTPENDNQGEIVQLADSDWVRSQPNTLPALPIEPLPVEMRTIIEVQLQADSSAKGFKICQKPLPFFRKLNISS